MDKKRRTVDVVDLCEFSAEELECAETLLSLSTCSTSSSSSTMDKKRKTVDVDLREFSPEELECVETLLSLSTCSSSSSSTQNCLINHKEPTSTKKKLKIVIRPPKPPLTDDLPSIDSIIDKFTHRDTWYGKKDVFKKSLTHSDTANQQARLAILHSDLNDKVREDFLNQDERDELEKTYPNGRKGQIRVKVRGCFSEKEHDMIISKWYYKTNGFKYALIGGWNPFRIENGLEFNDEITVAAVRSEGVLCFAIHGGRRQEAKPAPAPLAILGCRQQKRVKPVPVPVAQPAPVAVKAPAPCLLTWHRTLPRGAKGADWKHVDAPKLIGC